MGPDRTTNSPAMASPAQAVHHRVRMWNAIPARISRRRGLVAGSTLALLLLFTLAADLYRAAHKLLWFDEVCTAAVVMQGSPQRIWNALHHAADTGPPLFYVLETVPVRFFNDDVIGYRILPVLGFLCVPASLFFFVKRSSGYLAGLLAALVPLTTPLHTAYAIEARSYSAVAGVLALAILVWQHVDKPGRAWLLALLLALATLLHYYAVFALLPFAGAEIAHWIRSSRLRVRVWVALACGVGPLAACSPLLSELQRFYGSNFWARPSLLGIPSLYTLVLGFDRPWASGIILALTIGLAFSPKAEPFRSAMQRSFSAVPLEEGVMMMIFLCLPMIISLLAGLAHSGMTGRYGLPAVLGVSFAVAVLASRAGRVTTAATVLTLLAVYGLQQAESYFDIAASGAAADEEIMTLKNMLRNTGIHDLPVVFSNAIDYVPMAYRIGHRGANPYLILIDSSSAIHYAHSDSVDRTVEALAPYLPLNIINYAAFATRYHRFLLYSTSRGRWNWWPEKLRDDGYRLLPVAVHRGQVLYLAEKYAHSSDR